MIKSDELPNDVLTRIAERAGVKLAVEIWDEFGGSTQYFPTRPVADKIKLELESNPHASMDELASKFNVHQSTVYRNLKHRNNL